MRLDRENLRANIYVLVMAVIALAAGFGLLTEAQVIVVVALATEAIALGFALYWAIKSKAPIARQVVYGFLSALAAVFVVWGFVGAGLSQLMVGVVMAAIGLFIAESNTGDGEPVARRAK